MPTPSWLISCCLVLISCVIVLISKTVQRLARLERQVGLLMKHLGINPADLAGRARELARDPNRKIAAIKAYREETGASLQEAKAVVEGWIAASR